MNEYNQLLRKLKEEEELLQFDHFTNEEALEIGLELIRKAKENNYTITINITKNRQQIFHYSFGGTSPDNDKWIERKNNVVYRFHKSSFHIGTKLKAADKSLEEKYLISTKDYAPYGGAFPIIVKNIGVIGTITVSGLRQAEDHKLVVSTIKEYLKL